MINLKCEFQSVILATRVEVDVYLPNIIEYLGEVSDFKAHYSFAPFRTLYLLHGAWDSGKQWVENTSALRLCEAAGLAVVIPSVGNSFYSNTLYGARYEDYFVQELIGFVRAMFPLSEKREENYICGVSMGGYGSLRIVMKYPELFSKCAVMSSVVDIVYSARFIGILGVPVEGIVGDWKHVKGTDYDLQKILADMNGDYKQLPELFMIESTEDYLRDTNVAFHELLEKENIPHTYKEYPGIHEWKFWDEHLAECIDFIAG